MSLFPFWYSQISLPIQYTHKKQVLVWNTTQLFDKKHCTLSLMAIWVTILFQKKAVSIHLGKICIWGALLETSVHGSDSCKCQMSTVSILSVLDLLHFSWDCWDSGTLVTLCSQNTATSSAGTAWRQRSVGGNPRRQQAGAAFLNEGKNWYVRLVPFQFHVACQSA